MFITGGSGFVGRHLLRALVTAGCEDICILSRVERSAANTFNNNKVRWVKAGLHQVEKYSTYLKCEEIVLHLGAITGKAKPEEYFQTNTVGTRLLVEECKKVGVKKFLFVSSIAVKFPNKSEYHYAQSKDKAEEIVRGSGLKYVIIRPTMILGKESPIWRKLSWLAKKRRVLVLGDGRTKIQPIYVDDLIDAILFLISKGEFVGESLDLGGPEVIGIEEFLQRIHLKYYDMPGLVLHLPLEPIVETLSVVERYASSLLPLNVGQLSSFRYDGVAEPNKLSRQLQPKMKNVDAMLAKLIDQK